MADDKVFYPGSDRTPEENDSISNKKKRVRISRDVIAPQEGKKYKIKNNDNHKKSNSNKAIEKIIEDTRKDIEDMFRKERDDIMSQDRFKNLDPDDYDRKKDAISRYLENSKYRQLLDKTTFERINEYKRYQRQLPTIFGFSEKEEPMDPNERHKLWKTPDEMIQTQKEINDLGRKLIAKGKKLTPKFFGEMENYPSDEEEDNTSSSVNPANSSSSSSSNDILKRKREGGRRTKKAKKSKANKSKAKKSRSRK
jgi:hypothetical protein